MTKGIKNLKCENCPRMFSRKDRLGKHWLICIKRTHKCTICQRVYKNHHGLLTHTGADHPGQVSSKPKIRADPK